MKLCGFSLAAFAFASFAFAQQPASPPDPTQPQGQAQPQNPGAGQAAGQGGGRGWGRGMGTGRGVMGTITEVAPDHFTVKNMTGETWTVSFDDKTSITKSQRQANDPGGQQGPGSFARENIKASDIKAGDAIMANGTLDENAKSVAARGIMLIDPARAEQMRQMQANYGKTWLAGRVTAISDTSITVQGMDNTAHTFMADEDTTFRRRREPITLADLQVGDNLRIDGALKNGQFVAATVSVMMPPAVGGPAPRQGPPPQ